MNFMRNDINDETEQAPDDGPESTYRSDADRIVHRHLANKDDVITDDDLRNIRVGLTPPEMDAATRARFDGDEAVSDLEDSIADEDNDDQGANGKSSGANPINPWDLQQ